jgi:hypothetical protein
MGLTSLRQRVGVWIHARPGIERLIDLLLRPFEKITKIPMFGCRMCGQCVLHSTGLICPMTCPKDLRNGPCGGVRSNGACEVYPEKQCVWVRAYNQSQRLFWPHEIHDLRPAVDWSLQGSSSWLNYLTGRDQISGGCNPQPDSALQVVDRDE